MRFLYKLSQTSLLIILLLSTSSCVYFSQDVNLDPQIKSGPSDIGKNSKIGIVVEDKRDDKNIIGRRGNGMASVAPINNNQNLEDLIKKKVTEALEKNNFTISNKNNYKTLEIALLNLKYQSLFGFITIGSKIDVTLDVKVLDKNNSSIYKNTYRSNIEKRHFMFAPLASTNEKNINLSFQNAINDMLNDNNLIKSLK